MKIYLITTLFIIILLSGCNKSTEPVVEIQSGFCLTFDDGYVQEWSSILDLLDSNEVKATFFVTQIDKIPQEDIKLLKKIKENGNEIGSHGWRHINAIEFLEQNTVDEYCKKEIIPSIELMNANGLTPTSFSYPYGYNCDSLDQELLTMFTLLRDVTDEQRKPLEKLVSEIDEIYYKFNGEKIVAGLGIDKIFNITSDMLEDGMQRAMENNEVIVFYCHKPVKNAESTYQIEHRYLILLFELAKKYNLKSYTFSELVH